MFILDIDEERGDFDTKDWGAPHMDLRCALRPVSESLSSAPPPTPTKPDPKPAEEKTSEKKQEEKKPASGFDIMSILPMLMGGGNQSEILGSLLNNMGGDKKVGGMDLMSLLPLLMNGGLGGMFGGKKKETPPPSQTINLNNYKRVR